MRLDRVARDAELLADFPRRQTRWQEAEDRRLAGGQLLDYDELRSAVPEDEPFLRELDGAVVAEQLGLGGLDSEALTTLQGAKLKPTILISQRNGSAICVPPQVRAPAAGPG
jgi:hypothetical protein